MLELTLYHAVVSTSLPALVVLSLWPQERGPPWLTRFAIVALGGVLLVMAVQGWDLLLPAGEWPPFRPSAFQLLGALTAITLLWVLARRVRVGHINRQLTRRWPFFLAGFSWGVWPLGAWAVFDATRSALLVLCGSSSLEPRFWPLFTPATGLWRVDRLLERERWPPGQCPSGRCWPCFKSCTIPTAPTTHRAWPPLDWWA
jgi:hypothetical protein